MEKQSKNKTLLVAFAVTLLMSAAFFVAPVLAVETGLDTTAGVAGLKGTAVSGGLGLIVAKLIQQLIAIIGVIFVAIMVYSGFRWMTAGDSEENINEAKGLIRNAVIGLAIVLAAYSITSYVIDTVLLGTGTVQPSVPAAGEPGETDVEVPINS
ncbi:MAG: pilin [Patescibacteria group bacterium]|nr:pilin [Patescibacteria group bacterium]